MAQTLKTPTQWIVAQATTNNLARGGEIALGLVLSVGFHPVDEQGQPVMDPYGLPAWTQIGQFEARVSFDQVAEYWASDAPKPDKVGPADTMDLYHSMTAQFFYLFANWMIDRGAWRI